MQLKLGLLNQAYQNGQPKMAKECDKGDYSPIQRLADSNPLPSTD